MNGLEHPGVLDAFAHDTRANKLVLAMYEGRPWSGEDWQLFQLQEKLNAYISFILDGELAEGFPDLAGKPVEIQLRSIHEPDARTLDLIEHVRQQLALQQIAFEVIRIDEGEGTGAMTGCGCP